MAKTTEETKFEHRQEKDLFYNTGALSLSIPEVHSRVT
jgi:hypothetical protein